jgi:uncharacterized protein YbaP (TraB family)
MKRASLLLFFILLVLESHAQHSLIWKISGNGLTKTSYLMGTLKFIGEKEYYLQPNAVTLMKQSNLFAIEDQVDHHAQHEMNTATHFPKGQSLATVMTPEDYKKVKELFAKEFKVSSKAFDKNYAHIKPLPLSIVMTRLSLGEKVKFYDIELLKIAKDNNLDAYSLEPIEREAEALNTFSMEEQVKALNHTVDNFGTQKDEFKKLMADYRSGDLEEIFEFTLHPIEKNAVFVEEFYYKRNEEWLPKIEKMVKENNAFISLGIAHLEGERGILKLLEAKGYTLTPVPAEQGVVK